MCPTFVSSVDISVRDMRRNKGPGIRSLFDKWKNLQSPEDLKSKRQFVSFSNKIVGPNWRSKTFKGQSCTLQYTFYLPKQEER